MGVVIQRLKHVATATANIGLRWAGLAVIWRMQVELKWMEFVILAARHRGFCYYAICRILDNFGGKYLLIYLK